MHQASDDEALIGALAADFAAIPQVDAVSLGGSRSTGRADAQSDIDLYVYSAEPVPLEQRRELAVRRGGRFEVDNRFWEPGDEWDERATGIHVDVMYRDLAETRAQLERVLDRHEADLGYTTCLWHNVINARILFDRGGRLAALADFARRPYPDGLARAIIGKNHPLIRDSFGAFGGQILKATGRGDAVAVSHRTAAFLASYFDIIFAANRAPHPGEKRLLAYAAALPHVPAGMEEDVERLLSARSPAELARLVDALTDGLDRLLEDLQLAPQARGGVAPPAP